MYTFIVNRSDAIKAERVLFNGIEYLKAPAVAVRAMVLNGAFLPAEEIARSVDAWHGVPIPIGHPIDATGTYITANRPEQATVGQMWNPTFDGETLRGELWLDVAKATRMGGQAMVALQKLERGEMLELSTAYLRDLEETTGTHNGIAYNGIQRNIRPDHLALLLNEPGACSIRDGCGALRVNGLDLGATRVNAQDLIDVDRYRDSFGGNSMAEDKATIVAEIEETPVVTNTGKGKAAKAPCPDMAVNADQLVTVNARIAELAESITGLNAWVNNLGGWDALRETLQLSRANNEAMAANIKREKDRLVTALVANERCAFEAADLATFSIDQLGKLADSLRIPDYSGRGLATNRSSDNDVFDYEEAPLGLGVK